MTTVADAPTTTVEGRGGGNHRRKLPLTDRDKAERRLGVRLVAPAVIVMLAVTVYPICYSIWLSIQRYNLRYPNDHQYVWFSNYAKILSSSIFWKVMANTFIIVIISVIAELILGLALALFMHRAIFGRNIVRTAILLPYGIITVVSAFAFQFAVSPASGGFWHLTSPPLADHTSSLFVIILTEVWKTTPFMSLLLLAGLATVPDDYVEAAKVDGANAWQRLIRVILPNMRSAILVAVLFRTLDAVRIFDTVFIQTRGANDTATLSQLGYNQLISQLNLGLGSAVSVLLFLIVIFVAFIFVKGFRTDLGQVRGGALMATIAAGSSARTAPRRAPIPMDKKRISAMSIIGSILIVLYAIIPILWILSLSFKSESTITDGSIIPKEFSWVNYSTIFKTGVFIRPLLNSIGIAVISTVIAVTLATLAAYAIARLNFPGKKLVLSAALGIAMFPPISIVGPLFNMWRSLGLYDTWPGLIIPYLTFSLPLAIWTLSAFFRQIPWDLEQAAAVDGATPFQAFRKVIVPLAAPGVFTSAILVFFFAWNDFVFAITLTSTDRSRPVTAALNFFTGSSQFAQPTGAIAAAAIVVTVPIIIMVLIFQRRIVAGLTSGAVKG